MPLFWDFAGVDLLEESARDATTLLKFRRLLETHDLSRQIFEHINQLLHSEGLLKRQGTMVDMVDATIIDTLSSTKNADKACDPEMHQSRKGSQ